MNKIKGLSLSLFVHLLMIFLFDLNLKSLDFKKYISLNIEQQSFEQEFNKNGLKVKIKKIRKIKKHTRKSNPLKPPIKNYTHSTDMKTQSIKEKKESIKESIKETIKVKKVNTTQNALALLEKNLNKFQFYPTLSLQRGQEGLLKVQFSLNTNKNYSFKIIKLSGHKALDEAAFMILKKALRALEKENLNIKELIEFERPLIFKID